MINPGHYNILQPFFWQMFLDRLVSYAGQPCTVLVKTVSFKPDRIELSGNHLVNLLPLLNVLFQARSEDNKIVIPDQDAGGGYRQIKGIWLFIPILFEREENREILKSFVSHYYPGSLNLFTARFLKHLNKIVDLSDIVRKAGVEMVEFLDEGMRFTWPIHYVADTTAGEILFDSIEGLSFTRDEALGREVLTVSFEFIWAALSGANWSGDLAGLFESPNQPFYHLATVDFEQISMESLSQYSERLATMLKW